MGEGGGGNVRERMYPTKRTPCRRPTSPPELTAPMTTSEVPSAYTWRAQSRTWTGESVSEHNSDVDNDARQICQEACLSRENVHCQECRAE